jgi:serine/threonine protein kinase HipA of HipAB toxin-antitoxin module
MNPATCILQIFIDDAWRDVAALDLTGDVRRGVGAATFLIYLPSYAIAYWERIDAAALSVNVPVSLMTYPTETWPPFLVDLLPQGYGRIELLKQLGRDEGAGPAANWALLCAGAGNPIGNIRVKEAHEWASARTGTTMRGFTMAEIASRAGDFNEYLAQNGLFLAGSSGIQGEWPKILLTRAHDGLFYLDHTLPDEQAQQHYIVKFGRGTVKAIIEYVKRDIANIALGNKDNHARNTAIQRKPDGTISLTPLFDFAPMWLHPDGIARRIRWQCDDDGSPNWASVIAQACAAAKVDHVPVKASVQMMAAPLGTLFADALALGIDEQFLRPLHKTMEHVRKQLEQL